MLSLHLISCSFSFLIWKLVRSLVLSLSSFLIYAFKAINFPQPCFSFITQVLLYPIFSIIQFKIFSDFCYDSFFDLSYLELCCLISDWDFSNYLFVIDFWLTL